MPGQVARISRLLWNAFPTKRICPRCGRAGERVAVGVAVTIEQVLPACANGAVPRLALRQDALATVGPAGANLALRRHAPVACGPCREGGANPPELGGPLGLGATKRVAVVIAGVVKQVLGALAEQALHIIAANFTRSAGAASTIARRPSKCASAEAEHNWKCGRLRGRGDRGRGACGDDAGNTRTTKRCRSGFRYLGEALAVIVARPVKEVL